MIPVDNAMVPLKNYTTKTWTRLFKITRTDSTILRLTEHDAVLDFKEGTATFQYTPVNAPDVLSQRASSEDSPATSEFEGFTLALPGFDVQHIREGLYDRAKVQVFVVNWRYPWQGSFREDVYWMHDIQYSGEAWRGEMRSLFGQLDFNMNRIHNKHCDADVFDARCGITATGDFAAQAGRVNAVASLVDGPDHVRMRFEGTPGDAYILNPATGFPGLKGTWYRHGTLTWLTGANVIGNKTQYEVQYFNRTNGTIQLWTPTPNDIVVGDTFNVLPGCDKSMHGHCLNKFSNIVNHRGFLSMPTYKKLLKSPKLRF